MKIRNIGLLSIAFMVIATIAFLLNGNANSQVKVNKSQMAYEVQHGDFASKCGDGKVAQDTTAKNMKEKCGSGKCGDGKVKESKETKTKCGDGKAATDTTAKKSKEKCGSGKCGDGK